MDLRKLSEMGILWLVDRRPPLGGFSAVPENGAGTTVIEANPRQSAEALYASPLREVLAAAASLGPYNLVRIVCHGEAGHLFFSREGITDGNANAIGALHGQIQAARNRVGIEIHGCGVASSWLPAPRQVPEHQIGFDTTRTVYDPGQLNYGGWGAIPDERALLELPGIRLLVRMARAAGVGVKGGINYQWSDAGWSYEGPTISVLHGIGGLRLVLDDPANQLHRGSRVEVLVGA
jgi:hypothetical protein